VGEVIKPVKVEVDNLNADVGTVFAYVTYEMVKSCKTLSIFSQSISSDDVVLNEFSAHHVNALSGSKYRDTLATYKPGHTIILDKATCI
jgi:hypothetical protein